MLGFWWLVVQFRHTELTREPGPRRFAFLVSLHFILPGLVSLASLLSSGSLWRVAFAVAGLTGIAAMTLGSLDVARHPGPVGRIARLGWVAVPLYALLTLVAIVPDVARSLRLEPLQAEGYILLFVLLTGILIAWLLFTSPLVEARSEPEDGRRAA